MDVYINQSKGFARVTIDGPVFSILGDADLVSDDELLALAAGDPPDGCEVADVVHKRLFGEEAA